MPNLYRYARDNGAETLDQIVSTGVLDDQTRDELSALITAAVNLFLKEHPEAALGEH
jgi:hypothetical protein